MEQRHGQPRGVEGLAREMQQDAGVLAHRIEQYRVAELGAARPRAGHPIASASSHKRPSSGIGSLPTPPSKIATKQPSLRRGSDRPPISATVKWYNPEKGFGFIQLPTGSDAFLHVSVVER